MRNISNILMHFKNEKKLLSIHISNFLNLIDLNCCCVFLGNFFRNCFDKLSLIIINYH
jgi:ABC-type microcin C transport system permease subunit YejE